MKRRRLGAVEGDFRDVTTKLHFTWKVKKNCIIGCEQNQKVTL